MEIMCSCRQLPISCGGLRPLPEATLCGAPACCLGPTSCGGPVHLPALTPSGVTTSCGAPAGTQEKNNSGKTLRLRYDHPKSSGLLYQPKQQNRSVVTRRPLFY